MQNDSVNSPGSHLANAGPRIPTGHADNSPASEFIDTYNRLRSSTPSYALQVLQTIVNHGLCLAKSILNLPVSPIDGDLLLEVLVLEGSTWYVLWFMFG